jgi:hypothetical protein
MAVCSWAARLVPKGVESSVDRNSKGAVWGEWGEGRWCAGASMGLIVRH